MCIPLIARVVTAEVGIVEVELLEGEQVGANPALCPDAAPGQYVLLDRGLIVQVIS